MRTASATSSAPGTAIGRRSAKGWRREPSWRSQVQKVLDDFSDENRWHERQQEIVRRIDRDGEAFLRFFVDRDGHDARAVHRAGPDRHAGRRWSADPSASFGIQTDPDDVETVLGYYVDGEFVDAADVQHRRANVDFNVKRGLPLYTPVRKNLRRAEKLLRNMSVVAEIQSAIALIRKHRGVSRSGVEQFVAAGADATATSGDDRPHAAFLAVRPRHDPRRPGRPGIRLPGRAASTRPASSPCCKPSCGRSPRGW